MTRFHRRPLRTGTRQRGAGHGQTARLTTVHSYKLSYPQYIGATYDASTTNLTYHIPSPDVEHLPAKLTISFLSPITPTSSMRQSIPAAYVTVHVQGGFDVSVYFDLTGDFLSGDGNAELQWYFQEIAFDDSGSLWSWQVQKQQEAVFSETWDRAEWGTLRFSASTDMRYQSGPAPQVRTAFAQGGLSNQAEQNFGPIREQNAVFAYEKLFRQSNSTHSQSAVFTVAFTQDPVTHFASERGLTMMRPLWKHYFLSDYALIMFHYLDYHNAQSLAQNYSLQLEKDATAAAGYEYRDILALAARQIMGALQFSGTPDNPLIFLKEISSNGNAQTIDVIFPTWPFFMYTNPRWLAYLLEPQLEHQLSGQYPHKYSMHDLGTHFPNLTGHADGTDEYMPIEESGDIIIMALSIVQSLLYASEQAAQSLWSGLGTASAPPTDGTPFPLNIAMDPASPAFGLDDQWGGSAYGALKAEKWVKRSYNIFKQWTQYLVDQTLEPPNQLCTDDFAGWLPLQSNLALKGIIGIRAMAQLAEAGGHEEDASYYSRVSERYISKWYDFALSRDGRSVKLAYDWYGSWTTLYSLYADAALCFHAPSSAPSSTMAAPDMAAHDQRPIVPRPSASPFIRSALYANQSRQYSSVMQKYGLPLDSRHLYTKSDWQLQAAAVASPHVRQEIIGRIAKWINETNTDLPFTDLFETEGEGGFGAGNRFTARPVQGSLFSLLALGRACGGGAWSDQDIAWSE